MEGNKEKKPTLARLPGQEMDMSGRRRRDDIAAMEGTTQELIEQIVDASVNYEEAEHKAEEYAVASFVIEDMWDFIQTHEASGEALTVNEVEVPENALPGQRFVAVFNEKIDAYRDAYMDRLRVRVKDEEKITKSDLLALRYLNLKTKSEGHMGLPSARDLVTLIGRMGDVIPQVYARDLGRAPSHEEILESLDSPATKRFFVELMTNSRDQLHPILNILEHEKSMDLDDPYRTYQANDFVMQTNAEGKRSVVMNPHLVAGLRQAWVEVSEQRASDGKMPPRALQCPVLYTGKFVELYDWVASEFGKSLAENKYRQ